MSLLDAGVSAVDLRSGPRTSLVTGDPRPRLSWRLETTRAGVRQEAFQIQVSGDPSFERTLGDTGELRSDSSLYVDWPAAPLESRQLVYWHVRALTDHGWTPWSLPARLEAGLLDRADWQARFITSKETETDDAGPAPLFRRTFVVGQAIRSARMYVTALGLFEAWINGSRVGGDVLAPDWTSYGHRVPYYTYDITGFLQQGSNAIGVLVGNGWYRGGLGPFPKRGIYGDRLGLLAQIEITTVSGDRIVIGTDDSWQSSTGEIRYDDIYNGCVVDLRAEQDGWTEPAFDTPWSSVEQLAEDFLERVYVNDAPPVRVTEVRSATTRWSWPDGTTILDVGQNMVGWLRIAVRGGRSGDTVTVRHAEILDREGRLFTEPLRDAKATDTFTLAGATASLLEPKFTFHGFRYAEVALPSGVEIERVDALVVHSDLERTGDFACSDPLIVRLFENIVWSQRGNFLSIPTDCPSRNERLGWTGDAQIFADTGCFIFDCRDFLGRWLDDLAIEQRPDGAVPNVVPNTFDPYFPAGGGWGDAATIVPWSLYVAYGDEPRLRRSFETMSRWVDYCAGRLDPDGVRSPTGEALRLEEAILEKGIEFGDWVDPSAGGHPLDARADRYFLASAFVARSASLVAKTARRLGSTEDAASYTDLARRVAVATWRRWADHAVESQTGCAVALQFGIAPASERERVARALADLVESEGYRIGTGFIGTPLVLSALSENGYLGHAYRMLLETSPPSWLYQILQGATTIWERWDAIGTDGRIRTGGDASDLPSMLSFNHYAFGSVGAWMVRTVAGLSPDETEPGYRRVRVAPRPGPGITWARAVHRSPYGPVMVHWDDRGEAFRLEVSLPPCTSATVTIPPETGGYVTVDGAPPSQSAGVVAFDPASRTIELSSGSFSIEASR